MRLIAEWPRLSARTRAVILVAAGLMDGTPRDGSGDLLKLAQSWRRAARGKEPNWLAAALELLSREMYASDREIARRPRLYGQRLDRRVNLDRHGTPITDSD